ncbi:TPA: hypothetical protein HL430_24295 [Escherichia coli]|nr:hypothetical protein [Escherichia coli]HAG7880695.1 hypothetical protein [Escherichia coli]HAJ0359165.1 hypothetical protein [Escherichia coli]
MPSANTSPYRGEDFHLLVVLQPPQLKNSASHGATRHDWRAYTSILICPYELYYIPPRKMNRSQKYGTTFRII